MRFIDLVGMKFGRLTVLSRVVNRDRTYFLCQCDCGGTKEVYTGHLTRGLIRSCGCYRTEFGREVGLKGTHYLTNTPEYRAWANMKERCYNENCKSYRRYGGRGISVCERWQTSFETFLQDMGMKSYPYLSIERLDNNGDYEPNNCIWATRSQQQQNRNPFTHNKKKKFRRAIL